jgi:hypothetical protein
MCPIHYYMQSCRLVIDMGKSLVEWQKEHPIERYLKPCSP